MKQAISRLLARTTETLLPTRVDSRLRERRQWTAWIDSVDADSLADLSRAPDSVKRTVFSKHVKLVEIETHARCNRICSFCPNMLVDRRRNRTVTDSEMLRRIFTELGSVGYARQIKVARYSEPLANPHLYERIIDARRLVPRAQLAIVTNTDYLTRPALARLRDSGLDVLFMSIYLKTRERWSLPLAHQYKRELADKLGVGTVRGGNARIARVPLRVRGNGSALGVHELRRVRHRSWRHDDPIRRAAPRRTLSRAVRDLGHRLHRVSNALLQSPK